MMMFQVQCDIMHYDDPIFPHQRKDLKNIQVLARIGVRCIYNAHVNGL